MAHCPEIWHSSLWWITNEEPRSRGLNKKIQCLRSLMNKEKTHKLILIMFSWYQHIAGTSLPILEQNNQPTKHLNSVWVTDFIRLLKKFNVQLKLRNTNINNLKDRMIDSLWMIYINIHHPLINLNS